MKTYKQFLNEDQKELKNIVDVISSEWKGSIKRKKLKKLGYSDEEIDFIEMVYRDVVKKYTRSQDKEYNFSNYKRNFGHIGMYIHISHAGLYNALVKKFDKLYGK